MTLGSGGDGATFDTGHFAVVLSGSLSGPGSLTKAGEGTLTLTGSNTYTGSTTLKQGQLIVDGSLVSPVNVNNGSVLSGTGYLGTVTVNAGGYLSPGDPRGVLHLSGNLVLSARAMMGWDLDRLSTSDKISMPSGLLSLNGQQFSDFDFTPRAGFQQGVYMLIDAGSINGSLGRYTSGTVDGLPATLAISGNDLVLNVVPEPSAFVLLGAGVLGLIGWAWRQRRKVKA